MSQADELLKMKKLLDDNVISKEEFEKFKKEMLFNNGVEEELGLKETIKEDSKVEEIKENFSNIEGKHKKKKKFKWWSQFRYCLGILYIIMAFCDDFSISNIILFLCGFSLFPVTYKLILKLKKDISKVLVRNLSIILPIVLFILWAEIVEPNYFSEASLNLAVGENYVFEISSEPENYEIKSSDTDVITIEDNTFKALKEGTAEIDLIIDNKVKDTIKITVEYYELSDFELNINDTFDRDSTNDISITYYPDNASNKTIDISSSDNNVISIENGQMICKTAGTCTITAVSYNNIIKEKQITVIEPVTAVEITEPIISLYVGDTKNLTAVVSPSNATIQTLTWASSDNNVVSVNDGVLTAISRGSVTVTATSNNGITANCIIAVLEKAPISINNFKYSIDSVGGVEWTFSITNNTDKVINYVDLKWNCYNAVGDPIYDSISYKNSVSLRYTGPLEAYANSGTKRNTTKFYNSNYSQSTITYIRIIYADGTELVIEGADLLSYEGLIK